MKTAEQNYRLLQEIETNRMFMLMAYRQNPKLLERADARIKQMFEEPELLSPSGRGGQGNKQSGVSMVELIMFIVIISIAVAGILLVMNKVSGHSADALVRKQALAVAESLLEEIELQDFISASGATNAVTQANRASEYHIVSNYNNFATSGIFPVSGVVIAGLANYNASVAVSGVALGNIAAASSVLITVSVTDPQNNAILISGYRTAY
jgi:MSHA pilin protein MshD